MIISGGVFGLLFRSSLSVSDVLLQGCKPIIVEGASDQHYFNAIKLFLIKQNAISLNEELVFVPSGGVRGVPGIVSIVSAKDEILPFVILDSDKSGTDAKSKLASGLYKGQDQLLINAEVEDLFPISLMERHLNKLFRDIDDEQFIDNFDSSKPTVNQVENFAEKHNIQLAVGWKVELAKSVKLQLQRVTSETIPSDIILKWKELFDLLNV